MTREFPQLNSAEPVPRCGCVYGSRCERLLAGLVFFCSLCFAVRLPGPFPVSSASVPRTRAPPAPSLPSTETSMCCLHGLLLEPLRTRAPPAVPAMEGAGARMCPSLRENWCPRVAWVPNMRVFKSAFIPFHRVKMDIPKPRGILPHRTSNERSRSPLSIGALRSARN